MEKTLIFGHRKPDADAVCASIALSFLKNKLGMDTEARVIGTINNETRFVLKYFNVDEPNYLNDVKVQVKNIDYKKNIFLDEKASILKSFQFMKENNITTLPLIKNNKLSGIVSLKDITDYLINNNKKELNTSYDNVLEAINGEKVVCVKDEIKGNIIFNIKNFKENNNILITNDLNSIDEKLSLVILCNTQANKIPMELKKYNANIIATKTDLYTIIKNLSLANYIKTLKSSREIVAFHLNDYRSEIIDIINKEGYTYYPVLNRKKNCLGVLKAMDVNKFAKKNVILVDHNQKSQSVEGIDEANILEIIDHHNLQTIDTSTPISFRAMPVGSSCTIIYKLFLENNISIPYDIAGLMISAILSDTMLFKSPTTTSEDIKAMENLNKIVKIDIDKYGYQMFKAGSTISNMTPEEVFNQDIKNYKVGEESITISQVFTMDYEDIKLDLNQFINVLNNLEQQGFKVAVMFITDVIKNGSYILYNNKAEAIIKESYDLDNVYEGIYLQDLVSRKKQLVPNIIEVIQKKI